MDIFTILLFCISLLLCVVFDISIIYALFFGLFVFLMYGRKKGFGWLELAKMALSGIKTIRNIMITLLIVGAMTALWRTAGTIPVIISYASQIIQPSVFLVMVFILCSIVSTLTGTCFGTAATMGVICMAMSTALQLNPLLAGGAILAGGYVGDRCSPVSTSALLVAELTQTSIFSNIKRMLKTFIVPFIATCGVYTVIGMTMDFDGNIPDLHNIFVKEFVLTPFALIPAVIILVLSLLHVNVKLAMTASILTAIPLCVFVQDTSFGDLPYIMIMGFAAADSEVAVMINGGGVVSMVRAVSIVCISSTYSGIFRQTGLLDRAKFAVDKVCEKTTPYIAMLLTSLVTGMIACNQALSIMLTHQLCGHTHKDNSLCAINMEDTVVVTAPLIPWSIASGAALSAIEVSPACIAFAFFLYFLPLWRVSGELLHLKRNRQKQ